jgi:hypothetical protein
MRIDTECECERMNFESPGNPIPTLPPPIRSLEPVCVCARAPSVRVPVRVPVLFRFKNFMHICMMYVCWDARVFKYFF